MRYVQAAIHSTLHRPEDPRTGRGSCKANVEVTPECTGLAVYRLHLVLLTSDILTAAVDTVQLQLLQQLPNTCTTTAND